jgi:hypothetical protein
MQHFPAYHERKLTDGTHVFVATTGGAKRDGLALDMTGGSYDNYLRNPVFLWAHDYGGRTLPIGKTKKLAPSKGKLRAWVEFDKSDPFAVEVERKFDEGFLSAVSVGWMDLERDAQGVIVKWDLLDISAVPVPGDPDALIEREVALVRSFLAEHEERAIEDVDLEPAAILEVEEESAPDAALPPPVQLSRAQLGELVDERVKALAEAIAAYNQTEEQNPEPVAAPEDNTGEALRLLADTLKEIV